VIRIISATYWYGVPQKSGGTASRRPIRRYRYASLDSATVTVTSAKSAALHFVTQLSEWRHWGGGGGPPRVTPSRGWHPNEKKTLWLNLQRILDNTSCELWRDETTAKKVITSNFASFLGKNRGDTVSWRPGWHQP